MRPPGELPSVDRPAPDHAYGPATDVPDLVRTLYSATALRLLSR